MNQTTRRGNLVMLEAFDGGNLLRNIIISGLAGFMMFCISYAISVWLKRNRTSKAAKTAFWRVGFTLFFLGTAGVVATGH